MNAYFITLSSSKSMYYSTIKNNKTHVITFTEKNACKRFLSKLQVYKSSHGVYPSFDELDQAYTYDASLVKSSDIIYKSYDFEEMEYYLTMHNIGMLVHEYDDVFSIFPHIELGHSVYCETLENIYRNSPS